MLRVLCDFLIAILLTATSVDQSEYCSGGIIGWGKIIIMIVMHEITFLEFFKYN